MTGPRLLRAALVSLLSAPLPLAAVPGALAAVDRSPMSAAHPSGKPQVTKGDTTPKDEPASKGGPAVSPDSHKKCPYTTQECLNMMARRMKAGGWIGIEYEPKDPDGPKVTKVVPGSPAEKAGLQPGDVLYSLNGVEIRDGNDDALAKARQDWKPGQTVHYTIKRDGTMQQADVVLGEWPADILARYIGEHMLEHAQWDAEAAAKKGSPKK